MNRPVAAVATEPPGQAPVPAVMRLQVDHETQYRYGAPVDTAHHVAFLRPLDTPWQQVDAFDLDIDPVPMNRSDGRDVFGNERVFFTSTRPHRSLRVHAHSQVTVRSRAAAFAPDRSLPWEAVRERLCYVAGRAYEPASLYIAPSPFVPRLEGLRDYARASFRPGRPMAMAALDLMHRIHSDFAYEPASTVIDTPLVDVLAQRRGVCQDFAHLFVGALRVMGLAARYVSGYLLTRPAEGQPAMTGADASHAWAAAWCPGAYGDGPSSPEGDWLELDPTNDLVPDTAHVRVAIGRDYGDVTPLRGVIRGGGQHDLSVRVTTRRLESA